MESSTGIEKLKQANKFPVIFDNKSYCPFCEKLLSIDRKRLGGEDINVRYICRNCGLIFPIMHDGEKIEPVCDNRIYDFLNDFGEDIRYREL